MNIIYSHNQPRQDPNFGGKANQLLAVLEHGFNVPEFIIIPADYLKPLIPNNISSTEQFIRGYQFKEEFLTAISSYFEDIPFLAVRSSAIQEDGKKFSFAGQFDTKLFVSKENLQEALIEVWLSAYTQRVMRYQQHHQLASDGIAIIIQRMIPSESSGVAFSVNPITGNKHEIIINATWGLGEGIVSGELNTDTFTLIDEQCTSQVVEKNWAFRLDESNQNGTSKQEVSPEDASKPSLTASQILEVGGTVKKLADLFQTPQDVEFAFYNNTLYVLQTRAITALGKQSTTIWDNSNIVESYPALTSPLTFSFIVKMYEAVYTQLSIIMGIRKKTVEQHAAVYANMLGLLYGRVYYNLNNWHKSLSLLPGYTLNAQFMDSMMGVKEKFDTPIETNTSTWKEYWYVVVALCKIIRRHQSIQKDRIAFQSYFNQVMATNQALDFDTMSAQEILAHYQTFEQTLVKKWQAPLVNDFFCMIYFGVLQKLVVTYKLDASGTLHNDLVSGAKDIISTEPISLTQSIVKLILDSKLATVLFQNKNTHEIVQQLKQPEFDAIQQAISNYLNKWGERCVGELKLETITYKQQPENYLKILQHYVRNGQVEMNTKPNPLRAQAEELVAQKLKGKPFKKMLFNYVLKKARYLVSHRENLRFERTRGFGMVRNMMLAIGQKLVSKSILLHERDIFFLTQKEIVDYLLGTSVQVDLKSIVALRKIEYQNFENLDLPERIKTREDVYSELNFKKPIQATEIENQLKGIGCCAGHVRAKVSVIHSPHEIEHLNNTILVTASTDPGWVVLFPSAAAIVVERGSLLSHSAIVSREMGIPCIVGVKNLLKLVKTGDTLDINGATGEINIISRS